MAFLKFSQLKKYRKKKKRFQRSLPIPVPKIASTNVTCIWVQAFSKVSDPRKSIYCRESITNWVGEGVWLRLLEFDETPSRTLPHFVCRPWQQRKSKSVRWTRWRACHIQSQSHVITAPLLNVRIIQKQNSLPSAAAKRAAPDFKRRPQKEV